MLSTEVVLKVTEEESVFGDTTCAAGISVKVTSEGLLSVLGKMLAVISLIFLYRNKGGEGGRGSECDEGVLEFGKCSLCHLPEFLSFVSRGFV